MQEPITDPKEQLWKFLQAKKLYTKDYTEFSSQFSTPESQAKLHEFMVAKKAYTKSQEDFGTQFFKPSEKPLTYEDRQAQIVDMYNQKSQDAVNSDELIKAKSDSLMSVNQKAFTNFEKEVDAENKAAMTDKLSVLQKEVNENRLTAEEANEQLSQFGNSLDEAAKAKSTEYLQGIDNEAKEFFKNDKEILARQAELNAKNYREMQESLVSLATIQNQKDAARNEAVKEGEKDLLNKLPGGYSNVLMGTLAKSAISKGKYGLPQMVDQIDLMQSSMALSEARAIMQATEGLDPNKKIGARRADKDGYTPTVGSDEWLNPEKYNKPSNPKLSGGGGKSFSTETVGQARKRAQESLKTWTPKMGKYIDSIKVLEDKIAKQNINTDLLEVDSLDSFLTTATSIIGEQAVIMPLAMLGGSMAMETAEAYYSQVSSLAEANGITIQEVIEQGLDNTDVAVGAGIVSGSLDMLGTGKIINVLKKAVQGTVKKRLIEFGGTTATEFATEMAQSLTLQIANNAVSGEKISLRDALSEGLAGALMGGLLSSSVFLSKNSDKKAALKGLEERIANPNVELPVLDTTRDEQTGQEPAITAAEEVVNPNEQPIATEPTGNGVVSAENAQVGTEADPTGANDTAVAEPTNEAEQGQFVDERGFKDPLTKDEREFIDEFIASEEDINHKEVKLPNGGIRSIYSEDQSPSAKRYIELEKKSNAAERIDPSVKSIKLKHGTSSKNAKKIAREGFKMNPSKKDRVYIDTISEQGVFFSKAGILTGWDKGMDSQMPDFEAYVETDVSLENALFLSNESAEKYDIKGYVSKESADMIAKDGYNVLVENDGGRFLEGGNQVLVLSNDAFLSPPTNRQQTESVAEDLSQKDAKVGTESQNTPENTNTGEILQQPVAKPVDESKLDINETAPLIYIDGEGKATEVKSSERFTSKHGLKLFIFKRGDGQFSITEEVTGMMVASGKTKKEAISEFEKLEAYRLVVNEGYYTGKIINQYIEKGRATSRYNGGRYSEESPITIAERIAIGKDLLSSREMNEPPRKMFKEKLEQSVKELESRLRSESTKEQPSGNNVAGEPANTSEKGTLPNVSGSPLAIEEVVKSIPTAIQKTQGQVKVAKASLSNSLTNLNETLKKQRGNLSLNPFADPEVAKAFAAVAKDLADLGYLKAKEFTQALSSLIGEAISEADGKRLLKQARIDLGIDEAVSDTANDTVSDTANEGLKLDDTPQEGDKAKIRSAAKTLEKAFDQVEKDNIVAKVLGRAKPMFKTVSKSEAIEKAIAYIKEKGGFENILNYLLQGNTGTDYLPAKTVMRQLAIQYYGELLKGVKDNQQARENGFDTVESIITALRDEIAREGTKAGQSNAFIDPITILGSLGVEFHNYQARKENAKKVAGLKGKKKAEYEKLEAESKEVVETLNEGAKEAVDKTLKSDIVKKAVEAVVSRSKDDIKSVKESIDKRKKAARERWKAARKSGLNATIIPGLTSADIEFGVEMASLFIEEGIVNLKELGTRIRAEFNNEISQENAEKIAAMVSSEAIDKVQGNAKPFIREKVKEMNLAIQELIRSHFLDQAKAGKKIGEKLVEELGLKGADAKKLEKIIQDEFNKYLEPYKQKALEKSLAPSEKVTQRVRKTYFEKMTELINLGALTTESYREAFGKKFGLTKEIPMTEERKFQDLIDLINRLPEGKYLQTKAKMTLMGELSKYNGTDGFLAAWLDMAYTNSLSGATTFWVNFRSNAQNLLEIPLDMINPVAWVNSFTEAIKDKSLSKLMKKNPLAKAMFLSYAVAKGVKSGGYQFLATMQTGGVDNKYFESMNDPTGFRMSNFEKPNESRSWPFKALPVKIGEKTINANPLAVAGKWVRNLVATDLFFRSIAREVELMRELLDMKIADPNSKALWTDVMNDFYVRNPDKRAAAKEKADEEIAEYERSSGNKLTAVEKKVIQNESLDREMGLSEDVLMSAEDLARDYNFTLPRNGLIPKMTKAFSKTIHNSVLAKITLLPTMPFSTIIGRIGDRSLDFVPYYGFMRAYGYGGTGIYQRMKLVGSHGVLDAFNPKTFVENSSQMGEKGTRMREAQLRKAGIGLSVSMIATAVLLGTDEDDYFFISGSYASFGDYDVTSNMDKSFPKYTIKVGDFKFNYLNTPFAAPLLYIGNKNDMTRSGEYDEKGYLGRFMLAAQYTAASFKDISILSSIDDMVGQFDALREILFDTSITQKRRTQLFVGTVAKPSISFYSSAMPQNNNMIKQINKFFDPTSYSQKTIEELAAYYSGVHMFFDNKLGLVPRHDLFGEPVKTIPGSTMISADWFRDSKADDPRWRFLIDNKAIPRQKQDYIAKDTGTGLILEDVPVEKQLEYKKLTGEYFSEMLEKYMNTRYVSSDSYSNIVVGGKEVTKAQDAISRLWTSAGQEAAGEVFYKR